MTDQKGLRYSVSHDHLLKCNYYSQGCDGGFGHEIARFAMENQLVSDTVWSQVMRASTTSDQCYKANFQGTLGEI